jgi:peptide/nickel transport system ATP-binding protein
MADRNVANASALRVEDLVVEYETAGGIVHAVSGVSFELHAGETLGLVGESGCGKSSVGRAIMHLPPPTSGRVELDGQAVDAGRSADLLAFRRRVQMIFQDPISSLNPRRAAREVVLDSVRIADGRRAARDPGARQRADELMRAVGLDPSVVAAKRPHQLSGGQCQRLSIARALYGAPDVLICDEPVSALDVSVQAQVLNLLEDIKREFELSMVFVAHDLAVVRHVSDRVAVMYLGRLCEVAPSIELFDQPAHPYTTALLASVVGAEGAEQGPAIEGEPPSPLEPPSGCRFRTRCPHAFDRCEREVPQLREIAPGHAVACHLEVAVEVGRSRMPRPDGLGTE